MLAERISRHGESDLYRQRAMVVDGGAPLNALAVSDRHPP